MIIVVRLRSSSSYHALRGGCWGYVWAEVLRASNRNWSRPGDRNDFLGFRITR